MKPRSPHWDNLVEASTQDYVNARISEELSSIRDDIDAITGALLALKDTSKFDLGGFIRRLNNVEEAMRAHDKTTQ